MKRITYTITALALILLAATVSAKGGAGGTPRPSCTEDTFSCDAWSPEPCPQNGRQTRNCVKTFDCGAANTAEPATVRNCTPPAPEPVPIPEPEPVIPEPTPEPVPEPVVPEPIPEPEPTPEPVQEPPEPSCDKDLWNCSPWSGCEEDGRERRSCTKTFDCPTTETPSPQTERICPDLSCGHLSSMEERVQCRLDLTEEERQKESNILYFPEYCRAEKTKSGKQQCVGLYWDWEPCWRLPAGPERMTCGHKVIGAETLQQDMRTYADKDGDDREGCRDEIAKTIQHMVLFALYELEFKAEELLEQDRTTEEAVTKLIVEIENTKIAINQAKYSNWKPLILRGRQAWNTFIDTVQ